MDWYDLKLDLEVVLLRVCLTRSLAVRGALSVMSKLLKTERSEVALMGDDSSPWVLLRVTVAEPARGSRSSLLREVALSGTLSDVLVRLLELAL